MTQRQLANLTGEHYQTINAIMNGKREITIPLSVKLDHALGFEEGFFAIIQTYYNLKKNAESLSTTRAERPIPDIRPVVFWDTDTGRLDWARNKSFIIDRVLARGNQEEIRLTKEYYGLVD